MTAVGCQQQSPQEGKGAASSEAAKAGQETPEKNAKPLSGRDVLNRMVEAYQKASSYADKGTVRLIADKIDQTDKFSVALDRPNKVRIEAYQAQVVCDGEKMYASINYLPGQVLVKPAPPRSRRGRFSRSRS